MNPSSISSASDLSPSAPMSEAQQLHLRVSCQHIDKLLSGIEDVLHAAESKSPFPKYQIDLDLQHIRVLEDFIRRFRTLLVRTLAWQDIAPPEPKIPATRAIGVNLTFIDITLSEMRPSEMRGAGEMPEAVSSQLSGVVHELSSLTESMTRYLRHELTESLQKRISSLSSGQATALLRKLEEVVTSYGLVDFRPRVDMLLSRMEDQSFEIAVFGRVSSGKSSFLNALLGTDALPVGVNPITAVPTRISFGDTLKAFVRYGTGSRTEVSLEEFKALISERTNPGNQRAVTRAALTVPSARLSHGITLVDTPGLGSLARRGASETLAYLPSCDLALLLLDAGSTLTEEDIGTLRLIRKAGIPSMVLLSKCDLLNSADVDATTQYIGQQLSDYLNQVIPVLPVSSIREQHDALEKFYADHLRPQIEQSEALKAESVQRKLNRLLADVGSVLERKLNLSKKNTPALTEVRVRELEATLRATSGQVGELESAVPQKIFQIRSNSTRVMEEVAERFFASSESGTAFTAKELSANLDAAVATDVDPIIRNIQQVAGRAVEETRRVGVELGRSDLPEPDELNGAFREAPRFELADLPDDLSIGSWSILGQRVARSHLLGALTVKLQPGLDKALNEYSNALEEWFRSLIRILRQSVNSYLDAYRGMLQHTAGSTAEGFDPSKLRADLLKLQSGTATPQPEGE